MELVLSGAIGVLVGSGVWLLMRPRTYQVIIGLALLLPWWLTRPGDPAANRYGPPAF